MKAKYIFIHADDVILPDTVIYTVMLGTSQEDKRLLKRCQSLRFLTSCYFKRYDDSVATFISRIADSLFPGVLLPILRLQRRTIDGRQFNQLLNDSIFASAPSMPGASATLCQLETMFHHQHQQLWNRQ